MKKLFAFEDDSKDSSNENGGNDLLIDKVLEKAKQPKSPLSLTADLINQRQELKKDINAKLEEEPQDTENTDTNNNSNDNNTNDDNSNTNENDDNDGEGSTDNNEPSPDDKKKSDNDEDDTSSADDKDDLSSLVGSGLSSDDQKKEESKDNKETATESLKVGIVSLKNIFKPLNSQYDQYKFSLESYCLENQAVPNTEQPIVYVKESLKESLNNLITLANNYIENNNTFTESNRQSVTDINERVTVFKAFVDKNKYHFTNKLINDKDILANVSCPNKSDLRDTFKILLNYIEHSNNATSLIISNDFNTLESGYINSDYIKEGEDLKYKDTLPGFNDIRLHIESYKNYLSTNIQNYQYYKLKVFKTEDLYNLNAISITEDKELEYIVSSLDKLLLNISLTSDNLSDVNTHFTKFVDDIKTIVYDIDQDKYEKLTDIDIDSKIQDFIKFKLAIETYYINIKIMIEYMTSVISIINQTVELKN